VTLRRFHVRPDAVEGTRLTFDAEEARHMARTLRLAPGDLVAAVDGHGRQYTVRLEQVAGDAAVGTVLTAGRSVAESRLEITLAPGVPKGDKLESVIRAATELGVARIAPVLTDRTVVRLDPGRWRDRARRWQRVAKEAAKQCGRAVIPPVEAPRPLPEVLDTLPRGGLRLCLWEGESRPLDSALAERAGLETSQATVLVGPEGGLSPAEVELAVARGFVSVSLGPRILRTETVGPAIVAVLQSRLGDLGR
jgi:16S rRNA (uracil1498-N3)-methyltransferase